MKFSSRTSTYSFDSFPAYKKINLFISGERYLIITILHEMFYLGVNDVFVDCSLWKFPRNFLFKIIVIG